MDEPIFKPSHPSAVTAKPEDLCAHCGHARDRHCGCGCRCFWLSQEDIDAQAAARAEFDRKHPKEKYDFDDPDYSKRYHDDLFVVIDTPQPSLCRSCPGFQAAAGDA